ncbi:hypothetical protein IE53DRAFT_390842 [Violaceomyces palustris]|uniref:Uncharacterized protein n=1 Tax=Violaceomyces palustris TaxID=1673888 RepID=A0ACD0NMH3_9BASI|nr:hypothetical protein IE53DRAFT_390842 [Violaceomyces palustris]
MTKQKKMKTRWWSVSKRPLPGTLWLLRLPLPSSSSFLSIPSSLLTFHCEPAPRPPFSCQPVFMVPRSMFFPHLASKPSPDIPLSGQFISSNISCPSSPLPLLVPISRIIPLKR